MSENRERGLMSFFMLLMIGVFAWRFWPLIKVNYRDPEIESSFWLIAVSFGALALFLLALAAAGLLNKDPFSLSGEKRKISRKKLTKEEQRTLRKCRRLDRDFDKL